MAAAKKRLSFAVSDRHIAKFSQTFGLLADQSRLKILLLLAQEGEMHVSALCTILGQLQPAVSHHLTLLRTAGLVSLRRDGKYNYYQIDGDDFVAHLDEVFGDSGKGGKIDFGDFTLTYARNAKKK